jgi:hypothetical protein
MEERIAIGRHFWIFAAFIAVVGCTTTGDNPAAVVQQHRCQTNNVAIDTDFPTGNIASCEATAADQVSLKLVPEDAPPINCSPWYAFRIDPRDAGTLTIKLDYEVCGHRYWPKTSTDGHNWSPVGQDAVFLSEVDEVKQAQFTLKHGTKPLFVAGQEIVGPSDYQAWIDDVTQLPDAVPWVLGQSLENRPIPAMTIKARDTHPREQIVLIGRQHPPEITGALALFPFVETLLSDEPVAIRFRKRFETIVIPMLNPDGVTHGHWRHSSGHKDLNRDWGPFTQPETQLMAGLLEKIEADPARNLRLFIDFHSTQKDVFYTIPDDYPTNPPLFLKKWLARLSSAIPGYEINRDANHNLDQPNSKNYVYAKYRVPTVTFEIGDETDRALIALIGREAALAMMHELLATEPDSPTK